MAKKLKSAKFYFWTAAIGLLVVGAGGAFIEWNLDYAFHPASNRHWVSYPMMFIGFGWFAYVMKLVWGENNN